MNEILVSELLLPGWLVLALLIRILRRDRVGISARHGCVGLVMYGTVWIGVCLTQLRGLYVIGGLIMFIAGHAGLFGWAVSPGGMRFLFTPLAAATGRWAEHVKPPPTPEEDAAFWGPLSLKLALFVVTIDLVVVFGIAIVMFRCR